MNKNSKTPSGVELAQQAVGDDPRDAELRKALEELSPEEAEMFVRALTLAMKKRRYLLMGYLSAIIMMAVGMIWALYMYGTREPGTFIGWVFLVPFLCAGLFFIGFGKLSKSIKK